MPSSALGCNRYALVTFTSTYLGGIIDRLLPQMLDFGSDPEAEDKPPVVSMSPNHTGVTENSALLEGIMADEVERE